MIMPDQPLEPNTVNPPQQNNELTKIQGELEEYQKKAEDYLNSWKRAAADFENYRKRRAKEDQALVAFAKEIAVVRLLPALQALEQALKHAPAGEQHKEWNAGIESILAEMDKAMQDLGVERIKTVGEKYNHELHEAVEMLEGKGEPGAIVEEVAAGYKIDGRVVRPAKVKVLR